MFRVSLCLFVWGIASCSITCPDGSTCSDSTTCCKTEHGYACCPYPKAVCCLDLAHCCPSGFTCNLATLMCDKANQPWLNTPMVKKEAAEKPFTPLENSHIPEQQKGSVGVVHCDNYYVCPDGTTCCRHPKGGWFCCGYSPGRCCLDGYHCCPWGYDCDHTYTHCVRQQGLRYPFTPKQALSSVPAALLSTPKEQSSLKEQTSLTALTEASSGTHEVGVIRCDSRFFCPQGKTCCKGSGGQWSCCPYRLGECCSDGKHCCDYGYKCDSTSMMCKQGFSEIPAGTQERAKSN
ncbi:granulins isoform X1 [Larimichthys crocea]|uniref:granulins isoform X1 n=1 Tax=Larimichthys crocea TaxID=215358 RepID=UPI00090199EB|nr:granulins isoform X1 [Larimichthys crocea]